MFVWVIWGEQKEVGLKKRGFIEGFFSSGAIVRGVVGAAVMIQSMTCLTGNILYKEMSHFCIYYYHHEHTDGGGDGVVYFIFV